MRVIAEGNRFKIMRIPMQYGAKRLIVEVIENTYMDVSLERLKEELMLEDPELYPDIIGKDPSSIRDYKIRIISNEPNAIAQKIAFSIENVPLHVFQNILARKPDVFELIDLLKGVK